MMFPTLQHIPRCVLRKYIETHGQKRIAADLIHYKLSRELNTGTNNHSAFHKLFGLENKIRVQQRLQYIQPARKPKPGKPSKKIAAVLVPLCTVDGVPSLLYTLRSKKLSSHKGQVSFPGGNADDTDRDEVHTALRETEEELGVSTDDIDVWGMMNAVPGKDYKTLVTPVIANIGEVDIAKLQYNKDEVAEVFTRSLESLCRPDNVGYTRFRSGYTLPVFIGGQHRIWGLTGVFTHMTLATLVPSEHYTFELVHR